MGKASATIEIPVSANEVWRAVLVLSVICILAFSGCSSFDDVRATRAETANFMTGTEHGKVENPRVHPGQPYTQEIWLDL